LWDLKAKAAGMPLYQLLGGACRSAVRVYGHANGETVQETIAEAQRYVGSRLHGRPPAVGRARSRLDLRRVRDKMFYEPADGALPVENRWSTRKYLASTPGLFEAARAALGWDIDLLHDTHHRLTPHRGGTPGKGIWSPTGCSGWKIPWRRTTKRLSASFASTPPRRSPWAKCSTVFGIANS